jgi:hypothetical protein
MQTLHVRRGSPFEVAYAACINISKPSSVSCWPFLGGTTLQVPFLITLIERFRGIHVALKMHLQLFALHLIFASGINAIPSATFCDAVGISPSRAAQVKVAFTSAKLTPQAITPGINPRVDVKAAYGSKQVNLYLIINLGRAHCTKVPPLSHGSWQALRSPFKVSGCIPTREHFETH